MNNTTSWLSKYRQSLNICILLFCNVLYMRLSLKLFRCFSGSECSSSGIEKLDGLGVPCTPQAGSLLLEVSSWVQFNILAVTYKILHTIRPGCYRDLLSSKISTWPFILAKFASFRYLQLNKHHLSGHRELGFWNVTPTEILVPLTLLAICKALKTVSFSQALGWDGWGSLVGYICYFYLSEYCAQVPFCFWSLLIFMIQYYIVNCQ